MSHHKVEVNNLSYSYPDGHQAVKEISFTIHHGEAVGIVGANGAGKSTLLMLLMGLLPPQQGDIYIGDILLTKKTLPLIRQRMGLVFQDPEDQLFMTTVFDDVAFGPRNYGLGEKEVAHRVEQALLQLGIAHLKERAPFKLSGGEKRSVAIATVLAMQPDILVMDEPTAGLDPKSRRRIIHWLAGFAHTKIITSHDLDMVYELCARTIVIKDGMAAADGASHDILSNAALMTSCGLELPLALQSCPHCGQSKPV